MFNPRAAVGNGSRLSCHNIPKKIAAAPFQCSVCLRNGVKTSNVRVRQLRRARDGALKVQWTFASADRSEKEIRTRASPAGLVYTKKVSWKDTFFCIKRARDGTRTRDPDLGKVVLHQLSHSRIIKIIFTFCEERETGLEPATPTLARSCSTN